MSLSGVRSVQRPLTLEKVPKPSVPEKKSGLRECTQLPVSRLTPALLLSMVLWALLIGAAHLTWRLVG